MHHLPAHGPMRKLLLCTNAKGFLKTIKHFCISFSGDVYEKIKLLINFKTQLE